ncbi:hypothetical protein HZH66_015475 [Vespula vulgaris]|uniref:Thioester reductase (TE) domain-containing protein n=1 Tax=Vespula vulgaris TaxID=7454 RepID=A0A834IWH6_VESVU|nr:hypothetical protein HZH66_015475 [Vespula vulgaris]
MVETIVYTITFTMILVIRFNGSLKGVIESAKENMRKYNFENEEEKIIYNNYHYASKMFFKISNIGMVITVTLSYIRPLINFTTGITVKDNSTDIYILPIRIRTFFELSNTRDYILVYLYLFPMIYMSTCHMTAICVLVNLVFLICADLSILSYRIRNITIKSKKNVHLRIRSLIEMHLKTIWMAKSLDNAFNIVLLDELLGNSIVLAISMYYVIMSYDTAEMATCCTFVFFAFTALLMLYGFCVIGDQLTQQSENVLNAYYECNWLDMSNNTKKLLVICMIRSQTCLQLTGGRFYVFSLNSFTDEQGQKELDRAALILSWNKKIMSTLGLWPNSRNNIKFSINFGYFSFLMILEYMDLVVFINDLEHVIMNLTENMAFSQIFVRMIMLWIYNDEIGDVINETIKDFDYRRYKSIEERQLFISYNTRSKLFVKLLITFVALTASSYYLTPILVSLGNGLSIFPNERFPNERKQMAVIFDILDIRPRFHDFANCTHDLMDAKFYDPNLDAEQLIDLMNSLNEKLLDDITPQLIGTYSYTYVFTTSIAESVVRKHVDLMPIGTFRSSICWINNTYRAIGITAGVLTGLMRIYCCDRTVKANLVPTDLTVNVC